MSLDQFVGLSGIPLFVLFFLNYCFSAYVATHKLEEIQSHLSNSRFVASHRGDKSTPIVFKVGSLEVVYALLVLKVLRNLDPESIEEVNNFPKQLRPWVIIPGHINTVCVLWFSAILVWINIKQYL
ncbi:MULTISPECIES: hypothetical protein [Pseudomonas]|uniref:hypothetical protein n=1 Tax=Pseudomonas TaxID=286 RepID=UPI000D43A4F3|nr:MULTISPECIES: hypothetical protein [Pseudomonas]PTT73884.1 hypothetical protein DBR26_01950 [Pseudomonas sp. HMWF007]PTT91529.1 hypothetical protein DBR29_11205 [Pseudomonas sp. HMWF005]RON63473.1 hypothetical protein BK669_13350 [Pseudomonas fluorescens]MDZ3829241.1 hypothetical protein [Pseudomonas monsensis]PTS93190.1 hypothetical protein DBR24_27855 [Pseudomonas sp. HMWF006]